MAEENTTDAAATFNKASQANDNAPQPAPTADQSAVSNHTVNIDGKDIPYKATVGHMIIKNDAGEPIGQITYTAYNRTDVPQDGARPISFMYNGGPGSSSAWMHMGAFGPRQVQTADGTFTAPPPYTTVNNPNTLLDKTDMVFIDPVGTGFSKPVGKGENKDFWGVTEDINSIEQFVSKYISQNNRWNSPKFLIGESYGTFRSALLANALQQDNIALNGVVLMSSVLDFNTLRFGRGNDQSYDLYLPSYAATAWYHGLVKDAPKDVHTFIKQAEDFATGEYAQALQKGSTLTDAERKDVAGKLAHFTGLSEDYILKSDLRISEGAFTAELQRDRGLVTGRLDARFSGPATDIMQEEAGGDPQSDAVSGAFAGAFNSYIRNDLGYNPDQKYELLNYKANMSWDWKMQQNGWPGAPNAEDDLAQAMLSNPNLKVQIENGIYDLATPFFATQDTVNHLGLPADIAKNITQKYYDAGHMMYLRPEDGAKLKENIAAFIDSAAPQAAAPKAAPKAPKAAKAAPKHK